MANGRTQNAEGRRQKAKGKRQLAGRRMPIGAQRKSRPTEEAEGQTQNSEKWRSGGVKNTVPDRSDTQAINQFLMTFKASSINLSSITILVLIASIFNVYNYLYLYTKQDKTKKN